MHEAKFAEALVRKLVLKFNAELAKGEARSVDRLSKLEKELNDSIERLEKLIRKRMNTFSLPGSDEGMGDDKGFSYQKAMAAIHTQRWDKAGLEKEIFEEMDKKGVKAMGTTPDSGGGFIVPMEVLHASLIPLLRERAIIFQLGVTTLSGLNTIPTFIPRVSGGTVGYWVPENGTITPGDLTLEQIGLRPKTVATLTVVSELLLQTANPSIEAMLRADMALELAEKLDSGALKGLGSGGEPKGIMNQTNVGTTSVTAGGPTYNELINMVQTVRGSKALFGNLGWAIGNAEFTQIWQMVDAGATQQLERRVLADGPADKLLGFPYQVTTALADNEIIFGNWSDLIVADWGPLQLASTNALGFTTMQNHVRAAWFVDVGNRHAESFCIPS